MYLNKEKWLCLTDSKQIAIDCSINVMGCLKLNEFLNY